MMNGAGKMIYADGRIEEGTWRDDTFVGPASVPVVRPPITAVGNSKTGLVTVKADDEASEVFVDAAYMGNTPARLKLAEGSHTIEVRRAGFKGYRQEIKVSEGSELNVRAVLEKL
jgi:hypothetical protein